MVDKKKRAKKTSKIEVSHKQWAEYKSALHCIQDICALLYDEEGEELGDVSGADFLQEVDTYLRNYGFVK